MFNIIILTIGKVKERYFQTAIDEYLKRLSPYAKITFQELKAESFSSATKLKAKEIEGSRLINFLDKHKDSKIYILDERGKEYTSVELAGNLEKSGQEIIFVIGGSLGLNQEILKNYTNHFSLSKLTLPHELARVVLVEQLYRSVTILKNKEYHY